MKEKTVLITGCSSGIGLDTAKALSKRGYQVIASCRNSNDLKRLSALGLEVVQMDLNHSDSIHAAFNEVMIKTSGKLDVLINNAGFGQAGALEDLSRDVIRSQFETNVFGLMELTRLAILVMRTQGHGRIINLSSILGVISLPFRGAYNASKYAVEGLSDTLRLELHDANIQVILIEPGPIESQFRETSIARALDAVDVPKSHFKTQYHYMINTFKQQKSASIFTRNPDAVIKKILHAIESKRPKAKYPVTFPAHLFTLLKRLLPVKALDYILRRVSSQEIKKSSQ